MSTRHAVEVHPLGVLIRLQVAPGGSRDQIVGRHGDRIRVKVAAPPEGGKANRAVCALLAAALGCSTRDVDVVAGPTSRLKTVLARGITPKVARRVLA